MSTCSVVIPVRNGERFVAAAIESLLRQTVTPAEIIVIDDGSTDKTPEILSRCNKPVKVITTPGSGASAARNVGIKEAKGEYIAFLDCDDISHPERLEKQIAALESDRDAGMVFCAMAYMNQEGHLGGDIIRCPEYNQDGFLGQLFERNRIGSTSAAMLRQVTLDELGGFDENLAYNEEYDLWLRVASLRRIAYLDETLLRYRLHSENVSRSSKGQRLNEIKALQKHSTQTIYEALTKTYPQPEAAKLALARVLFRMEKIDAAQSIVDGLLADGFQAPFLYFLLANIHMLRNKQDKAESAYKKCIMLSPDYAAAHNNLGVIYAKSSRYNEAASAFKTAITLKKCYADPLHNATCLGKRSYETMKYTFAPLRSILKPFN